MGFDSENPYCMKFATTLVLRGGLFNRMCGLGSVSWLGIPAIATIFSNKEARVTWHSRPPLSPADRKKKITDFNVSPWPKTPRFQPAPPNGIPFNNRAREGGLPSVRTRTRRKHAICTRRRWVGSYCAPLDEVKSTSLDGTGIAKGDAASALGIYTASIGILTRP